MTFKKCRLLNLQIRSQETYMSYYKISYQIGMRVTVILSAPPPPKKKTRTLKIQMGITNQLGRIALQIIQTQIQRSYFPSFFKNSVTKLLLNK